MVRRVDDGELGGGGRGGPRVTFRNPRGLKRYYQFYVDNSAATNFFYYAYSTDGKTWTVNQNVDTLATYTYEGFDVHFHDDGSQLRVFVTYVENTEISNLPSLKYKRGTITDASSTISWDSEDTIANIQSQMVSDHRCVITRTDNGRIVVVATDDETGTYDWRRIIAYGADGDGANPSWTSEVLHDVGDDQQAHNKGACDLGVTAFSSSYPNRVAVIYRAPDETAILDYEGHIEVLDWNGSAWSDVAADELGTTGQWHYRAASVVIDDSDKVHLLWVDADQDLQYSSYPTAGSLGTETTTEIVTDIVSMCSISIDRTNDVLYAFYRDTTLEHIHWKKTAVSPTSWSVEKNIGLGDSATALSVSDEVIEGSFHIGLEYSTNDDVYYYEFDLTPAGMIEETGAIEWGRGGDRVVFRNPRGNKRYYVFYVDNIDSNYYRLCYAWNDDPENEIWSTHTIDTSTSAGFGSFNAHYRDTGSQLDVFTSYVEDNGILQYRKGTVGDTANTITFSSEDTVANLTHNLTEPHSCAITRTDSGYVVVLTTNDKVADSRDHRYIVAYGGDGDGANLNWTSETILDDSASANAQNKDDCHVGITNYDSSYTNRVAMIMRAPSTATTNYKTKVYVKDWNGSSWSAVADDEPSAPHDNQGNVASILIDDDDKCNILYVDSNGNLAHAKYATAGSLGTETEYSVKSGTPDCGSLSIDRTNDTLYAYYCEGTETQIHYKTTPVATISWSSEETIDTGTIQPISIATSTEAIESAIHVMYEGSVYYHEHTLALDDQEKTFTVDAHLGGGAVVTLEEWNGAGPSYTDATTAIMCTSDTASPSSNYPVKIPSAGYNYSYWKHIGLYIEGDYTAVSNIRLYCDGTVGWNYGTNGELRIGHRDSDPIGCPTGSYDQASGTEGTTGDDVETHTYYSAQSNKSDNMEDYTSGNAAVIDNATYTTNGVRTRAAVLQVKLDTDATQGLQSTEVLTFLYDEI